MSKAKTKIFVLSNHNTHKWTLTPTRMFTIQNGYLYIIKRSEVGLILSNTAIESFYGTTGRASSPVVDRHTTTYNVFRNVKSGAIAFGCKRFNAAAVAKLRKWAGVA